MAHCFRFGERGVREAVKELKRPLVMIVADSYR